MKSLRILLLIAGLLVSVLGIGLAVFITTFDANAYRARLGAFVEQATGRELTIGGTLELSVWPRIAVVANDIGLANAAGFTTQPMLHLDVLELALQLRPLLRGGIEIDALAVRGAQLRLESLGDAANWRDLQAQIATPGASTTGARSMRSLHIARLDIDDLDLSYVADDVTTQLLGLSASVVEDPLTPLRYAVDAATQLQLADTSFRLTLAADADLRDTNPRLHGLAVTVEPTAAAPATPLNQRLAADIHEAIFDKASGVISAPEVTLQFNTLAAFGDLRLRGVGNADAFGADGTIRFASHASEVLRAFELQLPQWLPASGIGQVELSTQVNWLPDDGLRFTDVLAAAPELDVRATGSGRWSPGGQVLGRFDLPSVPLAALRRQFPELFPGAPTSGPRVAAAATLQLRYDPATTVFEVQETDLTILDGTLRLAGRGSMTGDALWRGTLAARAFDLRAALAALGLPADTADPTALTAVGFSGNLLRTARDVQLQDLRIELDGTALNGSLGYAFAAPTSSDPTGEVSFDLSTQRLLADNYLPATDAGTAVGATELPSAALRDYRLQGQLKATTMLWQGLEFSDATIGIDAGDGRALIKPLRGQVFGGIFSGDLTLSSGSSASPPSLALAGSARNINLGEALRTTVGSANLTGTAALNLDVSGTGATLLDATRSANGTVQMSAKEGAFTGVNLGHTLCDLYNQLRRRARGPAANSNVTPFDNFTASAVLTGGIAQTNDLTAYNSYVTITGKGTAELAQQAISYDLNVGLTGPIEEPNCEPLSAHVGQSIPVTVTGTFDAPQVRPDFGKLAAQQIRRKVEEKLTETFLDLFDRKRPTEPDETPDPPPEPES